MKNESKIYNFFIIVALLFWNPLSFYLLYKNTPVIDIIWLWVIYTILLVTGVIITVLIHKEKINNRLKDVILSCAFIGILSGIVVCINMNMGDDNNSLQTEQGIIFPKNYSVRSQTVEFDYKIVTNSIGIRDREINIDKQDKYRILCFGDSWTMGFGVNIENSWPRKVQDYLHAMQYENVEVLNCGRAGRYTTNYLEYMNSAVPLLKPDLVLVGVLQLEDLIQLYENDIKSGSKTTNEDVSLTVQLKYAIKTYAKHSVGNILNKQGQNEVDLKQSHINSIQSKLAEYDYLQKKQYELLSDSVKYLFETGNLNPGLLNHYVDLTYGISAFNSPDHAATKLALNLMDRDFKEMKSLCNENNAKLIFINMPTARFTGHKVSRTPNDIFNDFLKENNHIDSLYQSIAMQNDLPYIEMTSHFIDLHPKDKYFFKFDGHPNIKGYDEIARYIGSELITQKIIN